jgi:Cys-tRNA(Pro) deacylase
VTAKQEFDFSLNSKDLVGSRMNLVAYLKNNKVWFKIIEKTETVHTADAAAATGIPLERVTKSLVFLDENKNPILAIIPGNCIVNKGKLKSVLDVKNVELVPFEQAEKYSGYEPGATPPVYHKNIKKVVIDQKVMLHSTVFGGGGSKKKLVELKPEDIQKLNNAIVADIAEVKK